MSHAVLDGVRDLLPTFRERADEAERLRVVPESSMKELEETGFFRLLQPKRFDGHEADPVTFYTAVRDIASACGSTGWVSSVVGVHPWQVALFSDEAQQAVWGEDTNTRLSSSYAPTGKAQVAEGGYRLSGKWSFSSGCDHCQWVLLGGLVFNDEGQVVDFKTFMVPRKDYTILDVWHMIGLSGTGSNDIVVEDVFIPEAFTLSMGETGQCKGPGQEQNTSDLYKLPFHSIFTGTITTPIIGMAMGAYDDHVEMQQKRIARGVPRGEGVARPVRRRPHRQGVERDRRGLGAAGQQHPRGAGPRRQGREDPAQGPPQGPPRPGARLPARDRRDRLAVRGLRRPRADRGHAAAAGLARRARRSGARGQRPRARAADVRRARVRPQDRPRDVLRWSSPSSSRAPRRGTSPSPTTRPASRAPRSVRASRSCCCTAAGRAPRRAPTSSRRSRGSRRRSAPSRSTCPASAARTSRRWSATTSASRPATWSSCSTSSASRRCTCSATASAAVRRPGSPSSTPTGSAGWC